MYVCMHFTALQMTTGSNSLCSLLQHISIYNSGAYWLCDTIHSLSTINYMEVCPAVL